MISVAKVEAFEEEEGDQRLQNDDENDVPSCSTLLATSHSEEKEESPYNEEYLGDIAKRCINRGVCKIHETNVRELVSQLREGNDVFIAGLCDNMNRRMWWNDSTPLIIACLEGSLTLVKALLLLGADVTATNNLGSTGIY